MPGKVIHIDTKVHQKAKKYCVARKLVMNRWVESLICAAVAKPVQTPTYAKEAPAIKKIMRMPVDEADINVWIKPPFWGDKHAQRRNR